MNVQKVFITKIKICIKLTWHGTVLHERLSVLLPWQADLSYSTSCSSIGAFNFPHSRDLTSSPPPQLTLHEPQADHSDHFKGTEDK